MFIAFRDLWFARGRFALMGAVVAMLALLMVLLTGLSSGLVEDNISGVRSLPATHLSFNAESGVNFSRSTVERSQWEQLAQQPGITHAAPLGNSLFNAQAYHDPAAASTGRQEILIDGKSHTKGTAVDIAMFGVEPGSFIAPSPTEGKALGSSPDGVLISQGLVKKGVKVGDHIVLDRVGTDVTVVGVTGKDNYGHVPVVYAPLALWQEATFGPPGGAKVATVNPSVFNLATLIASDVAPNADVGAIDQQLELTTVTRPASFSGSPGYKEETGTLVMIEFFLYVIAAFLVGAFFMVWTIQRKQEIGLVKALGGSNGYVLKDALGQAVLILVGATAVGVLVGCLFGFVVPAGAPFALEAGPVLLAAFLVVTMGIIGAALSIRRITKVDPLIALNGAR